MKLLVILFLLKFDFTITVENVSVKKSFWIVMSFFVKQKLILPNWDACQHLR